MAHAVELGHAALGGAMSYEKPVVIDFGSIAEHTYWGGFFSSFWNCDPGGSVVKVDSWRGDS